MDLGLQSNRLLLISQSIETVLHVEHTYYSSVCQRQTRERLLPKLYLLLSSLQEEDVGKIRIASLLATKRGFGSCENM